MHYIVSFEVCAAIMLSVFTIFAAISNPLKTSKNKSYINMCVCIVLCCVSDVAASLLINSAGSGAEIDVRLLYGVNIFYFIMSGINGYFYFLYLHSAIGGGSRIGAVMTKLLVLPAAGFALFAAVTPVTRMLFYFDENNSYTFGSLHSVSIYVTAFYIAAGIVYFVLKRKDISKLQLVFGLLFSTAGASGMLIQKYLLPNVCLGFATAAMGAIMIYFILQIPDPYVLMRLLEELKAAKAEADAASKAKENFLANMSHEMRTPVNSMLGMSEMIIRKSFDSEITEYARTASNSGKALITIINNILDFTKLNSGSETVVNKPYELKPLIEEMLKETAKRIENKDITLELDAPPDIPAVLIGDRGHIKQVLMNLVSNAAKYTESGSIKFTVSAVPAGKDHVNLEFSVSDTGCGIMEEDLGDIFNSFYRINSTDNAGKSGAGLGLTISSMLMELLDGEITAESDYGKGSSFTVRLVQSVEDPSPMGEIPLRSIIESNGHEYFTAPDAEILITDDNGINLFVLHEFLKQFGIKADTANNGGDCFSMASQKAYDIIFLDHMMPSPDGEEVMKMIKETDGIASRGAAIVVITANAVSGAREQYLGMGFDDYISKPVAIDTLSAVLLKHLPKEKITRYENGVPIPGAEDIFSDVRLSHINTAAGLSRSNENREEYFTALASYAETAADYADRLDRAMRFCDMTDYSAAAGEIADLSGRIGADNLADMAKLQKMFASSGKTDDITAFHSNFLEILLAVTAEAAKICCVNRPELISGYVNKQ